MKNYILIIALYFLSNTCYAQEWIPYQPPVNQSTIVNQYFPVQYAYRPQPYVIYQWTPYVVQQNVVVEKQCLFHRIQTVVSQPVVQYFYQPYIIYR